MNTVKEQPIDYEQAVICGWEHGFSENKIAATFGLDREAVSCYLERAFRQEITGKEYVTIDEFSGEWRHTVKLTRNRRPDGEPRLELRIHECLGYEHDMAEAAESYIEYLHKLANLFRRIKAKRDGLNKAG